MCGDVNLLCEMLQVFKSINTRGCCGSLLKNTPQTVSRIAAAQSRTPCWSHIQAVVMCILNEPRCNYFCVNVALLWNAAPPLRAPLGRMRKCGKWRGGRKMNEDGVEVWDCNYERKGDRGGIREKLNRPLVNNQGALHGAELTNDSHSSNSLSSCVFAVGATVDASITKMQ